MQRNTEIFGQDGEFWDNHLTGRPKAPESLFDRIFSYHQSKDGAFGTVNTSEPGSTHMPRSCAGAPPPRGQSRGRAASSSASPALKVADDIEPGSVDMVFATNVMHFPGMQDAAVATIPRQLRPGGTFVAAEFGPVRFHEPDLQELWARISHEGGRQLP